MNPAKNTDYINLTKIINLNSTPKSHKNTNKINQIRLNFSTFCKAIELVGMRVLKTKNTNMTYDHGLEVKIRRHSHDLPKKGMEIPASFTFNTNRDREIIVRGVYDF